MTLHGMTNFVTRKVAERRLQKRLDEFDARIAQARAKHAPVAHIQGQKARFVHEMLKASRS